MKKCILLFLLLNLFLIANAQTQWEVSSPDKQLHIQVYLDSGRVLYRVLDLKTEILSRSALGLRTANEDLSENLRFKHILKNVIDDNYQLKIGKRKINHAKANEIQLLFSSSDNTLIRFDFRAYNDGAAFRYYFPERGRKTTVTADLSGFSLQDGKFWAQPYGQATHYAPAYENTYANGLPVGAASPDQSGWAFPALFQSKNHWVLLTESGLDSNFYGSHLAQRCENGVYKLSPPEPEEALGRGGVNASATAPFGTPWRTLIIARNLGGVVESNLVYHLTARSVIKDERWIRPGRVSWSWWGDHFSSKNLKTLKDFVDLSAAMHWEYSLVDANWNIMEGGGNIQDLVTYANTRHIGLILWYNSGGPHNVVTEQPRDIISDPLKRREEFAKLHRWGVKGIKVDFFQSDKQELIKLYFDILRDAASEQLLVDFHGCTLPRGWSRTFPNLMSMEAVKGAENYGWGKDFAEQAPVQNTILACTRNVVGPMDYTPVTFSDYACCPHVTTNAHELALSVLFESGLLHFADKVAEYRDATPEIRSFIRQVPTTWDDTRFVQGEPGKEIILARRSGTSWYLAGINGEKLQKVVDLRLPFLKGKLFKLTLLEDGDSARTIKSKKFLIRNGRVPSILLLPEGGFAGILSPVGGSKN